MPGTESSGYPPARTAEPERSGEPGPSSGPPTAERTGEEDRPDPRARWSGGARSVQSAADRRADWRTAPGPLRPMSPLGPVSPGPIWSTADRRADWRTAPAAQPAGRNGGASYRAATSSAGDNAHGQPGGENAPHGNPPAPSEEASVARISPSIAVPESSRRDGQTGWFVVLDDGREIDVSGLVLLGRNPHAQPGEEDVAELVEIADETRTVSKSHLAIATDSDGALRG